MMKGGVGYLVLFLSALSFWATGCQGCDDTRILATLVATRHQVDRDFAKAVDQWRVAPKGDTFQLGDGVRTGNGAGADLDLGGGAGLRLEERTKIRFLTDVQKRKQGILGIDIQTGKATLTVGEAPLELRTQMGTARLVPGTRLTLGREGAGLRIQVAIGQAEFITEDGLIQKIEKGQAALVRIGSAALVESPGKQGTAREGSTSVKQPLVEPSFDTAQQPRVDAAGPLAPSGKSASTPAWSTPQETVRQPADVVRRGKGSFTIHTVHSEAVVSFGVDCSAQLVVQIDGGSYWTGASPVRASIGRGRHRYELNCVGATSKVIGRGVVTVVGDRGEKWLSPLPPLTTVDADGRSYTISYQGRTPRIRFRWPNYQSENQVTFFLTHNGHTEQLSANGGAIKLSAGAVADGVSRFKFIDTETGIRSRTGTVDLKFDNVAPTVAIRSPADGSFARGEPVAVNGMVRPGWTVFVDGKRQSTDRVGRFNGVTTPPANQAGVTVMLKHRLAGVHYYVRRAAAKGTP